MRVMAFISKTESDYGSRAATINLSEAEPKTGASARLSRYARLRGIPGDLLAAPMVLLRESAGGVHMKPDGPIETCNGKTPEHDIIAEGQALCGMLARSLGPITLD